MGSKSMTFKQVDELIEKFKNQKFFMLFCLAEKQ